MEERWTFGGGTVVARVLAPGVLLVKMIGVQDDVRIVHAFEGWFAKLPPQPGGFRMFWDTDENSGYKTINRERLEAWQNENRARLASIVVLVRSKLMAMAVSIANLSNGGFIKVTSDRRRFDGMIAAALRSGTRPSVVSAAP
jgi:hypothetical protein